MLTSRRAAVRAGAAESRYGRPARMSSKRGGSGRASGWDRGFTGNDRL